MNIDSYNRLCRISERFQPRKFGRICQKLLALALRSAGYDHVVEREVQGVDVDAARIGGPRYSIEVKTTKGPTIALSAKDFECLRQRLADNYLTVIAVLRLSPLGDWIAIDSTKVRPGSYLIDKLSAYSIRHLESEGPQPSSAARRPCISRHGTPKAQRHNYALGLSCGSSRQWSLLLAANRRAAKS